MADILVVNFILWVFYFLIRWVHEGSFVVSRVVVACFDWHQRWLGLGWFGLHWLELRDTLLTAPFGWRLGCA